MSAPRDIPDSVVAVQIAASDPAVSAWVAANAGSGKTHVLAQRVIRLLLEGTDPGKILCLTYTKAAAANMATRVYDTLAKWTALDDTALDQAMQKIGVKYVDAKRRIRARRLFAEALETPGGLKVQTIHAFCTRLLHQFPFEANVAARFTVLEERGERELIDRLHTKVLLEAAAAPDSALGQALGIAIVAAADTTFREMINEAIAQRDTITAWIKRAGGVAAAVADLSHTLGIDPADTREKVGADFFASPHLPQSEWAALAALLQTGSKTDQSQAARLTKAATPTNTLQLESYLEIFCTGQGERRKSIVTKPIATAHPALLDRLLAEQERIFALIDRRRAVAARDRTAALLTIAAEVIGYYQREKEERGLLDYDDLIDKTLSLIDRVEAAWVHYKLDLGIDHVLIDEAQDTSPKQWEIISRLVSEFTAGKGARSEIKRTLFAVGDEKQSIFSFQGAEPRKFADMRRIFERAHAEAGSDFVYAEFKHSFRSGEMVLQAVDTVFKSPNIAASVTHDADGIPPHIALPDAAPGEVEIWPLAEPSEKREIEGWDAPFDEKTETSPVVRLARRIAKNVNVWKSQGIRPGEVLILVRQRGPLFEAIIRALKDARIEVAGADRLVLTEHIAVMDLMVLADSLLLEEDDLALATVLRSPLFGFEETELFDLAHRRTGVLRESLRRKARDNPRYADASTRLDALAEASRQETPFAFYAKLLGPGGGRAQFLRRLGVEAADALDEFLNLALDYERQEIPSLQGFVAWLRGATTEVKRDMEIARDEVRVMTAHGAKGLEARVVILADTTTSPTGPRQKRLLELPGDGVPGAPGRLVWADKKANDIGVIASARNDALQAAENEYRRLLYVAMTRAIERLVVCGAQGQRKPPAGCWYELVRQAIEPHASEQPADDGEGNVLRWRKEPYEPAPAAPLVPAKPAPILPEWLRQKAPREPAPMQALTPSTALEEPAATVSTGPAVAKRRQALARGRLVHRLLQSLPDVAPDRRREAAKKFLLRSCKNLENFGPTEQTEILEEVLKLCADQRFVALFSESSRAEVPIVGHLAGKDGRVAVSGQIDRLAVTDDCVLIADFKTNTPAPRRLEEVPPAYLTQLALYRAVLSRLYPDRTIRAALVWTDGPDLMEIPSTYLDAALARQGVTHLPVKPP